MPQEKFEYNLDYYSGAQAALYIEDTLVDEVTSLQWTIQQSKVPIYGYASQTFDEMASGNVIVQGSFSINFVEAGYLPAILNHHFIRRSKFEKANPLIPERDLQSSDLVSEKRKELDNWLNTNVNPSDFSKMPHEVIKAYAELKKEKLDGGKGFSTLTNWINDHVWGSRGMGGVDGREDMIGDYRRVDAKHLSGFDIYVRFNHGNSASKTIYKIEDVHLLGKAQAVVIDENPIQEVYSFYAKNVI